MHNQMLYHPCVQPTDAVTPLLMKGGSQHGSRKLRFCPPTKEFELCQYKLTLGEQDLPVKAFYQMKVSNNSVKTRRYLDVDSTFFECYGRQMDVETTLCAYCYVISCLSSFRDIHFSLCRTRARPAGRMDVTLFFSDYVMNPNCLRLATFPENSSLVTSIPSKR